MKPTEHSYSSIKIRDFCLISFRTRVTENGMIHQKKDALRFHFNLLTLNPLSLNDAFCIPENSRNFSTTKGLGMKISMKLVYQYMEIFFNF